MNDFERILTSLKSADVAFVIIGGVAATVHGSSRLEAVAELELIREERSGKA